MIVMMLLGCNDWQNHIEELPESFHDSNFIAEFEAPTEDIIALYLLTHPDFERQSTYRNALKELVLSDPTMLERIPKVKEIIMSDVKSRQKVTFKKPTLQEQQNQSMRVHSVSKSGDKLLFVSSHTVCVLDIDSQQILRVIWSKNTVDYQKTYLSDNGQNLVVVSDKMVSIHSLFDQNEVVGMTKDQPHVEFSNPIRQALALENDEGVVLVEQSGTVMLHNFDDEATRLLENVVRMSKVPNKNWLMFIQDKEQGQDLIYFDIAAQKEVSRFSIDERLHAEGWMMPGHLFAGITKQKIYVFDVATETALVDVLLPVSPTELLIHPSLPYLVVKMGMGYHIFDVERDVLDKIPYQVISPQFDSRGNLHYISIDEDVNDFYRLGAERNVYSEEWLSNLKKVFQYRSQYIHTMVYNFSTKEHHRKSRPSFLQFPIGYGLLGDEPLGTETAVWSLKRDDRYPSQVSETIRTDYGYQVDTQVWTWTTLSDNIKTSLVHLDTEDWYPLTTTSDSGVLYAIADQRLISRGGDCFYLDLKSGQSILEQCEATYVINDTMVAIYENETLTVYDGQTDNLIHQVVLAEQPVHVVCDQDCGTVAALYSDRWVITQKGEVSQQCDDSNVGCTVSDWLAHELPISGLLPWLKISGTSIPLLRVPDLGIQNMNVYTLTQGYWSAVTQMPTLPTTPQAYYQGQSKEYSGYLIKDRLDGFFENTLYVNHDWYKKSFVVAYDDAGDWARVANLQNGEVKDIQLTYGDESLAMNTSFELGPSVSSESVNDIIHKDWIAYLQSANEGICPESWKVVEMGVGIELGSSFVPHHLLKEYCE